MPGDRASDGPPLRVLLSEGSSSSAREAVTALGLAGYHVEICDPDPLCIGRFSRYVKKFHHCPGLRDDPLGYLAFIETLVAGGGFDVLLPIHEQGFLFARVPERLTPHVAVALPSFAAYEIAHGKASFTRLLDRLGLPHPRTRFAATPAELLATKDFPIIAKTSIGTASRGIWKIDDAAELKTAAGEMEAAGTFAEPLLVQAFTAGPTEHAQAVFAQGRLVACHVFRQLARGAGGGPSRKESVLRPEVDEHMRRFGAALDWHGALSLDYILGPEGPLYVDCNPRLVEPMSAKLAGIDLADILVRVSVGEAPAEVPAGRPGVKTHIAIQALFGCALETKSRLRLLEECWRLAAHRPPYDGSLEEFTPLRLDPPSVLPLTFAALALLVDPRNAVTLPQKRWGKHLLTPEGAQAIRQMKGAAPIQAEKLPPSSSSM